MGPRRLAQGNSRVHQRLNKQQPVLGILMVSGNNGGGRERRAGRVSNRSGSVHTHLLVERRCRHRRVGLAKTVGTAVWCVGSRRCGIAGEMSEHTHVPRWLWPPVPRAPRTDGIGMAAPSGATTRPGMRVRLRISSLHTAARPARRMAREARGTRAHVRGLRRHALDVAPLLILPTSTSHMRTCLLMSVARMPCRMFLRTWRGKHAHTARGVQHASGTGSHTAHRHLRTATCRASPPPAHPPGERPPCSGCRTARPLAPAAAAGRWCARGGAPARRRHCAAAPVPTWS